MNERNLSRKLSTSVVDALKAHGHILVVKGGAAALARELDELMAPEIVVIAPRIKPFVPLVGEPTSTFGDETVDQTVEDMVIKLTYSLMNSDHVEDVFAEDAVIRRDIFRVMRDGLREPVEVGEEHGGQTNVTVRLDDLGYVAATASRRADADTLRQAFELAAASVQARFVNFRAEEREAMFRVDASGSDEGLEIEEAVADELTDLVEQGIVELPRLERRIDLGRALAGSEQRALRPRIDAVAQTTLRRSPCHATWEMVDARTIRVLFTPLSEQDARGIDPPAAAFGREVAALLARVAVVEGSLPGGRPRAPSDDAGGRSRAPSEAFANAGTAPKPSPPAARGVAGERPRAFPDESSSGGKVRAPAEPARAAREAASAPPAAATARASASPARKRAAESSPSVRAARGSGAGAAATAAAAATTTKTPAKRGAAKASEPSAPARSAPKARKVPAKKR